MELKQRRTPIDRKYALMGGLAFLGLLLVVLWAFSWTPAAFRGNEQGTLNISRADFENARTTWVSHNISEYEMVVDVRQSGSGGAMCAGCGTYKLNVKDKQVTVLSYTTSTLSTPSEALGNNLQAADPNTVSTDKTIDRMFERIEKILTSGPYRCDGKQGAVLYDNTVEFDPVLGYPTLIKVEPHGSATPECPGGDIEQVKSLSVLNQELGH
jgi:Family of unknown function (DUF6174)